MKEVNLNFSFKDFEGNVIKIPDENGKEIPLNVGKEVASLLARLNEGDPIKLISWGIDWFKGKTVYLDDSDFKKFYEIVQNAKAMNNLMKFNIMKYLDGLKDVKEQPVKEESK